MQSLNEHKIIIIICARGRRKQNALIVFNWRRFFLIFNRMSNVILITQSLNGLGNGNRHRPGASEQFCGKNIYNKKIILCLRDNQKFRPITCVNITGEIAVRPLGWCTDFGIVNDDDNEYDRKNKIIVHCDMAIKIN